MQTRLQLLIALAVACAVLSPVYGAIFSSRSDMETYFGGYVTDIFFDLRGTGTPGAYYSFGVTSVAADTIDGYDEFETNPFLGQGYMGSFSNLLFSVGNTLLADEYGALMRPTTLYMKVYDSNDNYPQALGFYVESGPSSPPAVDQEIDFYTNYFNYGGRYVLSEGGFIGVANVNDSLYGYTFFGWRNFSYVTALSHMVMEPGYLQSGGDPHFSAYGSHSDMGAVMAGDVFRMVAHPQVTVDAVIRAFDFLPASMQESNYYGSVGLELANGDEVVVAAFEEEADGSPGYLVTVNGKELAFGSTHAGLGYELHYNAFGDLPLSRSKSHFDEEFPFQTHHAIVRLHVAGAVVVDVSLSSKEAFVDWHQAVPEVYRQAGAFLNMNMRELVQPSETEGLLAAMGREHREHSRLRAAAAKAEELLAGRETSNVAEKGAAGHLAAEAARHQAALEAFGLQQRVEAKVAAHKIEAMFA